ncbi:MAG TPA: hypothetical protein VH186_31915 [Chloroflexia bacterium]|nr:hypothetical protein [Chloroflexia bacterium]
MSLYNFSRQFRTSSSEGYAIMESDIRIGRVDLHYGTERVYATIVIEQDMEESDVAQIIDEIDNSLVSTASTRRDDLHVWVYSGREVGFFTDNEPYDEEFEGDEEEEDEDLLDELEEEEDLT